MPELPVSEEQRQRLDEVCADLETVYVGRYGTVRPQDALEYLLDTYEAPTAAASADRPASATAETDAPRSRPTEPTGGGSSDDEDDDDTDDGDADDGDAGDGDLTRIPGVGEVTAASLAEAGFDTIEAIRGADPTALTAVDGIGSNQAIDIKAAVAEWPPDDEDEKNDEAIDDDDPADASPEDTLKRAMDLLEVHADRWREGSNDEPYEVDLPDGSVEGVRTKDGVKRLLFKHWR